MPTLLSRPHFWFLDQRPAWQSPPRSRAGHERARKAPGVVKSKDEARISMKTTQWPQISKPAVLAGRRPKQISVGAILKREKCLSNGWEKRHSLVLRFCRVSENTGAVDITRHRLCNWTLCPVDQAGCKTSRCHKSRSISTGHRLSQ